MEPDQSQEPDCVAEQTLIGALLLDNNAFDRVCDTVKVEQCYREDSRLILSSILRLINAGQVADIVTVAMDLEARHELSRVGGIERIRWLIENTPSSAGIVRYAKMVSEQYRRRGAIAVANELHEALHSPQGKSDLVGTLQSAATELENLADEDGPEDMTYSATELVRSTLEYIQEVYDKGDDALPSIPTGLADLDQALSGGVYPGDLIIVAGRPAMGKTVMGMSIADAIAAPGARRGGMVLVFSMEMSPAQHGQRQTAAHAGIPLDSIRTGKLSTDQDWNRLAVGASRVSELQQLVDFRPARNVAQIRAQARKVKRKHGLAAIVIDYLQLMQAKAENRNQEITQISSGLKAIAKELQVPVIALAQLNRGVEGSSNKRPMMSHLRDGGSIEQDADTVILLYRDEYYNPDSPDKGVLEAIIGKNRMGEAKTVRLAFQGEYSRVTNLAPDWRPEPQPAKGRQWDDL